MPKVSVIIPVYNQGDLLPRAVKSILAQTYKDLEVIIVDDGSTDNTESAAKSFAGENVTYVRHGVNRGEGASRNTGISLAKGKYVAFLDSDDMAHPERLAKEAVVLDREAYEVGVVYSDMMRVSKNGGRKYMKSPAYMPADKKIYKKALSYGVFQVGVGTSMIRKSSIDVVGGFDEKLPYYVDMDFFIRVSGQFFFYHIPEALTDYYESAPPSPQSAKKRITAAKMILAKYYDDIKKDKKTLLRHYIKIASLVAAGMFSAFPGAKINSTKRSSLL